MRKLLLLFVTVTAGVFTLAWINFRRENELPAGGPSDDESPDDERSVDAEAEDDAPEPARCAATTSGGKRCTRETLEGSRFCWQHG